MKSFLRAVATEIRYGVCSIRFWGTVIAMAALLLLDAEPLIKIAAFVNEDGILEYYDTDILEILDNIIEGGCYLFWARFCLFAVPFGCCFFEEYSHGAAKYRLIRCNSRVYGCSKMFAGTLLTGAVAVLSNLLFCACLWLRGFAFVRPDVISEATGQSENWMYEFFGLLSGGHTVLFFLLLLFYTALPAFFFSSMTIMLSAFIRNRYILIAMPLTLFFGIDSLCSMWFYPSEEIPDFLNWRGLFFGMSRDGQYMEVLGTAKTALYTAVGVAIFTLIFVSRVREVTESEHV